MEYCKVCKCGKIGTHFGHWAACDQCGSIIDKDEKNRVVQIPEDAMLRYGIRIKFELGFNPFKED